MDQRVFIGLVGALAVTMVTTVWAQPDAPADARPVDVERNLPAPAGEPLSGAALDVATLELAEALRCPVCQGLSVASSPSPSAVAMRQEIEDLLAAGYTKEQVMRYFESAYGEFVRLSPKAEGFNLVVWVAPLVLLLLGVIVVWRFSTNKEEAGADASIEEDPFLAQVRRETHSDGSAGSSKN